MKRRTCKILVLALVLIFIALLVFIRKNVKPFEDMAAEKIEKIVIYYPTEQKEVTEQGDIKEIVQFLQTMKLRRSLPHNKDGSVVDLEIHNASQETMRVVISGTHVTTDDGRVYSCDRDYCDDFWELYEEMAQ